MLSARKVVPEDYPRISAVLHSLLIKLRRTSPKAVHQYGDPLIMLANVAEREHAYIVGGYLVIYEIASPWYAPDTVKFLAEQLVLRIAVSGDFRDVPMFLEQKAREAGCKLLLAGTALAKSDRALASLYHNSGFQTEAHSLIKEL